MCRPSEIILSVLGIKISLWWAYCLLCFRWSIHTTRCKICLSMVQNQSSSDRLRFQPRLLSQTKIMSFVHWRWKCKYIFVNSWSRHLNHIYSDRIDFCSNRSPCLILSTIKQFLMEIYRKELLYTCLQWSMVPQHKCFRDFPIVWNQLHHPGTKASQV